MISRNKVLISQFIACFILVAISITLAADEPKEKERPITWKELPEIVQESIREQAGDMTISELEEVTVGDQVFYEAEWMEGDMEVEILLTADGEVLEREVEKPDQEEDDQGDDPEDDD